MCVLNVDIFKRLDLHWSMYAHACSDNPQVVIKIAPTFPPERLRSFAHNVTGDFSTLLSSRLVFDNEGGCARWRRPTKLEKVFGVPHKGHYWSRTAWRVSQLPRHSLRSLPERAVAWRAVTWFCRSFMKNLFFVFANFSGCFGGAVNFSGCFGGLLFCSDRGEGVYEPRLAKLLATIAKSQR